MKDPTFHERERRSLRTLFLAVYFWVVFLAMVIAWGLETLAEKQSDKPRWRAVPSEVGQGTPP